VDQEPGRSQVLGHLKKRTRECDGDEPVDKRLPGQLEWQFFLLCETLSYSSTRSQAGQR
jgi:hypothetical protein